MTYGAVRALHVVEFTFGDDFESNRRHHCKARLFIRTSGLKSGSGTRMRRLKPRGSDAGEI